MSLWGQSGNATVVGQVTDASGAVVPEAAVSITNKDTNVIQTTKSNAEGRYSIPGLTPGTYGLTAEVQGFKKFERPNIVLQVGDRVAIDIALQIGTTGETVTVTAEIPLLRTEDAEAGVVIDNRRIAQLPQYNRNPFAFAQLAANVGGDAQQVGASQNFFINGGRQKQSEVILDGTAITTGYSHDVAQGTPSMEAISEFKVVTNGLSAEYGRLSGGVVVVATKSGTNELHGSAYEFFKNDKMNANGWNSNRYGWQRGAFHDNEFGFTVGGPVRIPKVYNGKDKTFFFLNFNGWRQSTGSNLALASVPTDLERQGDFSQSILDNKPVQIYDWTTGKLVNGQLVRSPFPGNRIPVDRFDPLSKIYLGYYPEANRPPDPGTTSSNNYAYSTSNRQRNGRWTGKLDQNWTSKQTTHFGLSWYDSEYSEPRNFSPLQATSTRNSPSKTATIEHTWTAAPTLIFGFHGGVVRNVLNSASETAVDTSQWPLDNLSRSILGKTVGSAPAMQNLGVTGLGGGSVSDMLDTVYSGSVTVQKLSGKHSIKAGFEHRRYYIDQYNGGDLSFPTDRVFTAASPADRYTTGSYFASWLLGNIYGGGGNQLAGPASAITYYASFIQDDIKLTRKLTLNLGLRWDYETPRTERYNRQYQWDTKYKWDWTPDPGWSWDLVQQQIGQTLAPPEWLSQGIYGRVAPMGSPEYPMRTLQTAAKDHFGPRLGVAYQVLPRTVIRASYGLLFLTSAGDAMNGSAPWNVGYSDRAMFPQEGTYDGGLTNPITFSNPFPNGNGYIRVNTDINTLNRSTQGSWWVSPTDRYAPGHEHDIQFSIQRELGSGNNVWVVEAAYTGNFGRSLPFWIGLGEHILPDAYHKIGNLGTTLLQYADNPFYGQLPQGARGGQQLPLGNIYQKNPLWMQISTSGDPLGTSNYNAGYVQVEHRFSGGFSLFANYTLSKLMQDTATNDYAFSYTYPQAGLGLGDIYSLSPYSYKHKFNFNYSYELPFGRGKRFLGSPNTGGQKVLDKVVGGWVVAGFSTFRCGLPLQVSGPDGHWWQAGQASNGTSERPVYVNGNFDPNVSGHASLQGSANFQPYLNITSFRRAEALPNLLEIGNVSPTIPMLGPAFSQWDVAMMKNFTLGRESRFLQLRFESQNVFNHMNAGMPGANLNDPYNFGVISSQNGTPRVAMINARLVF